MARPVGWGCRIHQLYSHMQNHKDTNNKDARRKTSLTKYVPLTFLQGFEKVIQGLRVRGNWRPNRNCNILTPTLMAVNIVSFSFFRAAQPEARGPFCWVMAFFTASYQHLLRTSTHQGPKPPSAWCGFPYHSSSITPTPTGTGTVLTSVLTELYNSSTPTQSPTRFLDSHVGLSSSGNNCHAVHRSPSSGASVYECTMGIFFTSYHFISQFPPTRFPLITAIRMCLFLPVHRLGMAFLAGSKAKIQHTDSICRRVRPHQARFLDMTLNNLRVTFQ